MHTGEDKTPIRAASSFSHAQSVLLNAHIIEGLVFAIRQGSQAHFSQRYPTQHRNKTPPAVAFADPSFLMKSLRIAMV
jgi:hypothetical protein